MNILILPGDGIGKEVTAQAARILKAVVGKATSFTEAPIGGEGVKAAGDAAAARDAGAGEEGATRSSSARSACRATSWGRATCARAAGCSRCAASSSCTPISGPRSCFRSWSGASSLKPELVEGLDLIVLRELNGDIYYGTPRGISTNADGRPRRREHHALHRARDRAHRARRLQGRARAQEEALLGGQGQRAGNHGAVARDGGAGGASSTRTSNCATFSSTPPPWSCCARPSSST